MSQKANKQIVCIAQFTAKPGKENHLIRALRKLTRLTHKEKGCIRYEINQQIGNAHVVTLVEKWSDKMAFDQHCAMPYTMDYLNKVVPKLVARKSVTLHEEILP